MAIPVLTTIAANKERKQVVDSMAGGRTLLISKCGVCMYGPFHSQRECVDTVANGLVTLNY